MRNTIKAVIFDMDGVLINSEHLWRKAMIRGFKEWNMLLSEDDCRKTMGMRFGEVIELWLAHHQIRAGKAAIETRVLEILFEYIATEGKVIDHIPELIAFCKSQGLRLGLATSSGTSLMNVILKTIGLENTFDVTVSAEHLPYGKPHPEVFLKCAAALGVAPQACMVIEDSLNGVIAGKAAQMQVIAVPDDEHTRMQQFAVSDHKMNNMGEVLALFKKQFAGQPDAEGQPVR